MLYIITLRERVPLHFLAMSSLSPSVYGGCVREGEGTSMLDWWEGEGVSEAEGSTGIWVEERVYLRITLCPFRIEDLSEIKRKLGNQ